MRIGKGGQGARQLLCRMSQDIHRTIRTPKFGFKIATKFGKTPVGADDCALAPGCSTGPAILSDHCFAAIKFFDACLLLIAGAILHCFANKTAQHAASEQSAPPSICTSLLHHCMINDESYTRERSSWHIGSSGGGACPASVFGCRASFCGLERELAALKFSNRLKKFFPVPCRALQIPGSFRMFP